MEQIHSTEYYRRISKLISNSYFDALVRKGESSFFANSLRKYQSFLKISNSTKNYDVVCQIYYDLKNSYRNEYVYKNAIVNKILLGKYSLNTASLLNEFKVGKSKADLVLLNGTSVVYEIKSELDSAERVKQQIEDYQKVFSQVNVVTHCTLESKYKALLPKEIGIISLSNQYTFGIAREAKNNISKISPDYVIKALRKEEYSSIILQYHGYLPNVPNTLFYTECKKLIRKIPKEELHTLMVAELKKRTIRGKEFINSENTPIELKHICLCLDFNQQEYEKLYAFLNNRTCTYLTSAESNLNYLH